MAYVTQAKLNQWIEAAGLTPADRPLARHIRELVRLVNDDYHGIVGEADDEALAAALGLSLPDYHKVRKLALVAGLLVQV